MPSRFIVTLALAVVAPATLSAQPAPVTTSPIRCESCARSGQRPASAGVTFEVVERVQPILFEGITLRMAFIGRVIATTPLTFEVLDSRADQVDARMTTVLADVHGGKDPATCGMGLSVAVSAKARAAASTLAFNELVTGEWMFQRDPAQPRNPLAGNPVLTEVRKITEPIAYFHPTPGTPSCLNRSGRLVVYKKPTGGWLTVFNDGGIHYHNAEAKAFVRQRLSPAELSDLLELFRAASFDTLPPVSVPKDRGTPATLELVSARHQSVLAEPADERLLPILERMNVVVARALADVRLVLRTGYSRPASESDMASAMDILAALKLQASRTHVVVPGASGTSAPVDLEKSPDAIYLAEAPYRWSADMGPSLRDVPADGLTIAPEEFEKHKAVYSAMLKRSPYGKGLSLIEGDRLFEGVRLCQVEPDGSDTCPRQ